MLSRVPRVEMAELVYLGIHPATADKVLAT